MSLRGKIIRKLKSIVEPELGKDVLSLNLVYNLNIDKANKTVNAKFKPKQRDCSVCIQLSLIIKMALMEIEELKGIELEVTDYYKAGEANNYLKNLDGKLIRRM